ncbi:DUF6543 domain-containing protein [Pseudomonas sp. HR96]|uniref:dermonecrotic toxin domain-containing protein n=1 Tax=Pseudomonas sp. HR96 TaxID=1027966 RepID=UPI002A766B5F|nr:DUF6543 domain-containing protein [Pseudomonas sp. HR96]WPP01517.1 DUF6543 domain-containing protein [Pseudomonas sp. HR96]
MPSSPFVGEGHATEEPAMPTEHFQNQYFLSQALRADFLRDVQDAALTTAQRQPLLAWADAAGSAGAFSVHHLQPADGHALPCSLSGAIVLRDLQSSASTIYLHSSWAGLEPFDDMPALTHVLDDRLGQPGTDWVQVPAGAECFEERMQRIFVDRLQRLEEFWQDWEGLPKAQSSDSVAVAEQALGDYWAAASGKASSRRQRLAAVLEEAYQHTLIEAAHERLIRRDEARWLQQAPLVDAQKASLYVEGGEPIKLAGAFVLHDHERPNAAWFLYLPEEGLHHCADEAAVLNTLTGLANLGDYLSLDDHARLREMPRPLLRLDPPSHELFLDRANSVIGLQRRNLAFSLGGAGAAADLAAVVDVRSLIDPTLLRFSPAPPPALPSANPALALPEQAQALQRRLHAIDARLPDPRGCAARLLDRGLACMGWNTLTATGVTVNADGVSGSLADLLLHRLTAKASLENLSSSVKVPTALLRALLQTCAPRVQPAWRRLLQRTQEDNLALLADLRVQALNLALQQQRLLGRLDSQPPGWPEQAQQQPLRFAQELQKRENLRVVEQAQAAWALAMALQLAPAPFDQLLRSACANTALDERLDQQISELRAARLEQVLPAWLKQASANERLEYAAALKALDHLEASREDYRFGIAPLHEYARSRIAERLARVQPDNPPDPDQVLIELPTYTPAVPWLFSHEGLVPESIPAASSVQRDSLTAYAISHFSRSQTAVLRARMADGSPAPSWMTPPALHQLVDRLDIGGRYRQLLAEKLSSQDPDFQRRRALFGEHSHAQLRVAALQARLAGELDATAYAYVQAVLDMPDGVARQPVLGQAVTFRPLSLVPGPGRSSDRVAGLCLIGPQEPNKGPLVLYASAGAGFVFKQFADAADLLRQAQTAGPLQELIVQQVADDVRSRYAHGGLREVHLPTDAADPFDIPLPSGPPTLDPTPWTGNAWHLLFDDRVQLLHRLAKTQTVSNAEAHWQSFQFLMGLGIEQVGFLAEGRLAQLLSLWAGIAQLDSAAEATRRHQWGNALGRLAYALVLLAPLTASTGQAPSTSAAHVAQDSLQADELREFETDQALEQMLYQPATGLYQARHGLEYAAVAGKVYPVWLANGRWRIGSQAHPGPWLETVGDGQWQLERLWDLRYGGALTKRARPATPSSSIAQLLRVRAVGMRDIRRFSRDKARRIGQAHAYAKSRLITALDNLNVQDPSQALGARPKQVIADFFGVAQPSPQLLDKVKRAIGQIFIEMIDPSLAPGTSQRFVYGENIARTGERMMGMISQGDPARRIFVTELFFDLPSRLRYHSTRLLRPFDLPSHVRAATLLHEVSHLTNDCEDIAYIEPGAPYLDLVASNDPIDPSFRDELRELADRLSVNTPDTELFMRRDRGYWVSLDLIDPPAAQRVLAETGGVDLADARRIFYADAQKRAAVILANADSVTMLIMLLGRPEPTV